MKKISLFIAVLWMVAATGTVKANDSIIIDGNFSDWAALSTVAHSVKSENSNYDHLYDAKFVRDDNYIYFYLEFDAAEDDFDSYTDEGWEIVHGYYAQQVEFFLNCGNEYTGCSIPWIFDDPAIDLMVEGSWTDQFKAAEVYACPDELNGSENTEWEWLDPGITESITCCTAVKLANGHNAIEGTISISKLPVKPANVLKIGVLTLSPVWDQSGALPETSFDSDGIPMYGKLISVPYLNNGGTDLPSEIAAQGAKIRKFFKNGQLYILREDKTYTLTGAEVH